MVAADDGAELRFTGWLDALDGAELGIAATDAAPGLLERYRRLGESFLDGVRGRFAVAVHDRAHARLLLARDGVGHFGLAWTRRGSRVAAAAEAAELRTIAGSRLDRLRLAEFFANEELCGERSFFTGVREVGPGQLLVLERESERRRRLPRPDAARVSAPRRAQEWVEAFAAALERAVARCLAGAGPVAVLGGGGLDSSTVAVLAAAARRASAEPPPALIAWRLSDPAADESRFAAALAAALAAPIEWVEGDDAVPFADLARWPVHPSTPEQTAYRELHRRAYERAASLGARTLLAGFGGDSLYTHGDRWLLALIATGEVGAAIDALGGVAAEIGWPRALARHLVRPLAPRRWRRRPAPAWLSGPTRCVLDERRFEETGGTARRPRQAARLLARLDGHGEQVERFYTRPFGLEQRTPLRDFDLIELALALPDSLLGRGGETRTVLRAAMRGRLPEEIRRREGKASFRALLGRGLEPARLDRALRLLARPDAIWREFVEPSAVERWRHGKFADDGELVGFLHAIYAELWRDRAGLGGVDSVGGDD